MATNKRTLIEQIKPDTLVLTPNQRLSQVWLQQFAHHQSQTVFAKPQIKALATWAKQLWQELYEQDPTTRTLLTPDQARLLWHRMIQDEQLPELLNVSGLMKTAMQAWHIMQTWRLPQESHHYANSDETDLFWQWQSRCQQLYDQQNLMDESQLLDYLIQHLNNLKDYLPQKIILVDFFNPNPTERLFFESLASHCDVTQYEFSETSTAVRYGFDNVATEYQAIAAYAKVQFDKSDDRILCVFPQLNEHLHQIKRCFLQVFREDQIDISAGQSLAQIPVVAELLNIFNLCQFDIPISSFRTWLTSKFFHLEELDIYERMELDTHCARHHEKRLHAAAIARLCKQPTIQAALEDCAHFAKQHPQSIDCWLDDLMKLTQQLGWLQAISLSDHQQQAIVKCQHSLQSLRNIKVITAQLSFTEFRQLVEECFHQTVFHLATPASRVQILGTLEACGMPAEHIWLAGLCDSNWPTSPRLNPLLPSHLQRQYHTPHSSAEREIEYCRLILATLQRTTKQLIVSYPKHEDDQTFFASPLIQNIPEENFLFSIDETPPPALPIDTFHDDFGPPLKTSQVSGGSGILKSQAACPFQAFAKYRLAAESIPQRFAGLDPSERGLILHAAMENFWKKFKNHDALQQQSKETLSQVIGELAKSTLLKFASGHEIKLSEAFLSLERQRLEFLLNQWLQIELERPPFEIDALEQAISTQIAGLTIQLRIDRIDQLADGKKIIIDYKTGLCHLNQWFDDRPDEPQLPLYAISFPEICGIAFAQIKIDQQRLVGISAVEFNIPGLDTPDALSWEELKDNWHSILSHLAKDYRDGHAAVDPKQPATTCARCDCQIFCRIHEHV